MTQVQLNRTQTMRRKFIDRHLPTNRPVILEIGPLDNPTYYREERDVFYMDWFTRDELIENHGKRRSVDKIPHIDYVIKHKTFSIEIEERFDLIIANHVFEHIPDVITWMSEVEKLLKPNGYIFLSLPDKRYTFDINRPETTFVEMLRCHHEKLDMPSYYHILEHLYYHRPVGHMDVWNGEDISGKLAHKRIKITDAMKKAEGLSRQYTDVHCHIFTRDGFVELYGDLTESGLIKTRTLAVSQVVEKGNEFHVMLQKGQ